MKNPIFVLFIVLILVTISGCTKKLPLSEDEEVYAGRWVMNKTNWIEIDSSGNGSYKVSQSITGNNFSKSSSRSITNGKVTINNTSIKIELLLADCTFSINKPPYKENGEWKMHLDNKVYVKQ